jgi:hypothetical protein
MTNETNPGTVEACPFCDAAMSHCSDKDGEFWMHPGTVTDGDCFMSGQGIFLRQLTAWNTRAAQSQPAATVQEAIDFKYWLMDAARILRSNGTDTHASWVEKALAALSPSKAVEPAPEQGEELQAALKLDDNGFSDAECIAISLDRYARDAKRSGLPLTAQVNEKAAWLIRSMAAALAHPSPAPQQGGVTEADREAFRDIILHDEGPMVSNMLNKGAWDDDPRMLRIVQHRLAHPSPAPQQPQSEKMLREALEKIAENDGDGLHMHTPQAMQHIARAALTPKGEAE